MGSVNVPWLKRIQAVFQPDVLDDYWYNPLYAPAGSFLSGLNGQAGLDGVVAAQACIRLIADICASLPLQLYQRSARGKEIASEHPLYARIHHAPSEELTSYEWRWLGVSDLLRHGNWFSRYTLAENGVVRSIEWIDASKVEVFREKETRRRLYRVRRDGAGHDIYTENEILHVPGMGFDGTSGKAVHETLPMPFMLAQSAEAYGTGFFQQGAMPLIYMAIPGQVSEKRRSEIMEYLARTYGGTKNAWKPALIEGGGEIKSVPINHRDIQFLELRKFQVEEIARLYRVPLHLIQSLDRATFSNIEHQSIDFARYTIAPWLKLIESRMNHVLLGPVESNRYVIEHNMEGLLRGDSMARAEYYSKLIASGVMMPNEARALENMSPVEGGDRLYMQGAMMPLDKIGEAAEDAGDDPQENDDESQTDE